MRLRSCLPGPALILGFLLGSCSSDVGEGGKCVPGATAMCWCDGDTPGVQQCIPTMTFAPCVCDDAMVTGTEDGAGNASMGSSGVGSSGVGSSGIDGSGTTSDDEGVVDGESSTSNDTTTGANTDGSTSDTSSDTCTDERYAYYLACLALADNSFATDFYNACVLACPPASESCAYSACTTTCSLDTPVSPEVQACRDSYPECVYAVVSEAQQLCNETCLTQRQACAEGTTCTEQGGSVSACQALYEGCLESCDENGVPSDGWEVATDDVCSGSESLALLYCRLASSPSNCISMCAPGLPNCGYQDCVALCYADDYAFEIGCEATWSDCPSSNPSCRSQCYLDEASCINTCVDVAPCATTRNACVTSCEAP